MSNRMSLAITAAAAFAVPLAIGCSKQPAAQTEVGQEQHADHSAEDHAAADHHDADHDEHHEHGEKALTEADVPTPKSFAAGVARLKELHEEINHLIEHNELANVHHHAEEMAMLARKMKPLASTDIADDKRTDAGRLCNEIAGYFEPIDSAADAGKKDATIAIHQKMANTIAQLESLSKK
jgi:Ni/Co efflux regulator RcnB